MGLMGDAFKSTMAGVPAAAAGQLTQGLMGVAGQAIGNKMQLKQAKKLQQLQLQGSQEMANYNRMMQMKMWEDTNYAAQVKQMQKAGLNIGLMYGGSGAGGTTGSAGGAVSGQGTQDYSGMMQGNPMVAAQIANLEADTAKKKAEAEKTSGVDTAAVGQSIAESIARVSNLEAVTSNERLKSSVLEWESTLKSLEATEKGQSLEANVRAAQEQANKLAGEAEQAKNAGKLSSEAYDDMLKQVEQTTIEQGLRMLFTEAGIDKTKMDTAKAKKEMKLAAAKVWEIQQKVGQGWQQLTINDQNRYISQLQVELNEKVTSFNTSDAARAAQWTGVIGALIGGASKAIPGTIIKK